ncbi:MAG: phospho-N-acetylmuramoyl-pentapeptide-transferase, partial [Mobilitalea sp.]
MNFSNYEVILPVIIAFAISTILCPFFIPFLKKLKFGQFIREEGPQSHQKKSGTPTMGGIVVIISIILTSFLYIKDFSKIAPILLVTIGFGIIGFIDDYIKVVKKRNLGLKAWQKLLGQILITVGFGIYIMYFSDLGTSMLIPFSGGNYIDASYLYWPIMFIAMLGTVNGSNFTDGLDGLESSVTAVIAAFLSVAAIVVGSSVTPITGAVLGSLLGYLLY